MNLTAAGILIHIEPWWNPATENRATDRVQHIGHGRPVFVYRLMARGMVEEKIQQLQQRKSALVASILDHGRADTWQLKEADIQDLLTLLPPA